MSKSMALTSDIQTQTFRLHSVKVHREGMGVDSIAPGVVIEHSWSSSTSTECLEGDHDDNHKIQPWTS